MVLMGKYGKIIGSNMGSNMGCNMGYTHIYFDDFPNKLYINLHEQWWGFSSLRAMFGFPPEGRSVVTLVDDAPAAGSLSISSPVRSARPLAADVGRWWKICKTGVKTYPLVN